MARRRAAVSRRPPTGRRRTHRLSHRAPAMGAAPAAGGRGIHRRPVVALSFFNVGVESGQAVGVTVALLLAVGRRPARPPRRHDRVRHRRARRPVARRTYTGRHSRRILRQPGGSRHSRPRGQGPETEFVGTRMVLVYPPFPTPRHRVPIGSCRSHDRPLAGRNLTPRRRNDSSAGRAWPSVRTCHNSGSTGSSGTAFPQLPSAGASRGAIVPWFSPPVRRDEGR